MKITVQLTALLLFLYVLSVVAQGSTAGSTTVSTAANCSEEQLQQIVELQVENLRSSECEDANLVETNSDGVPSVCGDSVCLDFLSGLAERLPDCVYRGVNYSASSEYTMAASCKMFSDMSLSYDEGDTTVTFAPSGPKCSSDQLDTIVEVTTGLIDNQECANVDYSEYSFSGSGSGSGFGSLTLGWCSDKQCVDYWVQLASSLPDCAHRGLNYRTTISYALSMCGQSIGSSESTTDTGGSSTTAGSSVASSSRSASAAPSLQADGMVVFVAHILVLVAFVLE